MNPYRFPPEKEISLWKPRTFVGFLRTTYRKLLVWKKGPWKVRFTRCPVCNVVFNSHNITLIALHKNNCYHQLYDSIITSQTKMDKIENEMMASNKTIESFPTSTIESAYITLVKISADIINKY